MWDAIANLAWPALAAFVLFKLWPTVTELLHRGGTTIKVAGLELSISEATKTLGKDLVDLQERLSRLEVGLGRGTIDDEPSKNAQEDKFQRLLWVDDYPSNNAFIVEKLTSMGITIDLSLNTGDALRKFTALDHKLIISDLGRVEDGVDNSLAGLDLVKAVRRINNDVPILIFAGQRGFKLRDKLLEAGATDVTASGVEVMKFIERNLS